MAPTNEVASALQRLLRGPDGAAPLPSARAAAEEAAAVSCSLAGTSGANQRQRAVSLWLRLQSAASQEQAAGQERDQAVKRVDRLRSELATQEQARLQAESAYEQARQAAATAQLRLAVFAACCAGAGVPASGWADAVPAPQRTVKPEQSSGPEQPPGSEGGSDDRRQPPDPRPGKRPRLADPPAINGQPTHAAAADEHGGRVECDRSVPAAASGRGKGVSGRPVTAGARRSLLPLARSSGADRAMLERVLQGQMPEAPSAHPARSHPASTAPIEVSAAPIDVRGPIEQHGLTGGVLAAPPSLYRTGEVVSAPEGNGGKRAVTASTTGQAVVRWQHPEAKKALGEDSPQLFSQLSSEGLLDQLTACKVLGLRLVETTLARVPSMDSGSSGRRGSAAASRSYEAASLSVLLELGRSTCALPYWHRTMQSFVFVFVRCSTIVLESPNYGRATYLFRASGLMPIEEQLAQLSKVMARPEGFRQAIVENWSLERLQREQNIDELLTSFGNPPLTTGLGGLLHFKARVMHHTGCGIFKRDEYKKRMVAQLSEGLLSGTIRSVER